MGSRSSKKNNGVQPEGQKPPVTKKASNPSKQPKKSGEVDDGAGVLLPGSVPQGDGPSAPAPMLPPPTAPNKNVFAGHPKNQPKMYQSDARLKWNKPDPGHIWDVTYNTDGSIIFISTAKVEDVGDGLNFKSRELQMLSKNGEPVLFPFPTFFHDPRGVLVDKETSTLLVSDWCEQTETGSVSIFRQVSDSWSCQLLTDTERVTRLAITPEHGILCTRSDKMFLLGQEGQKLWEKNLPTSPSKYAAYVAVTNRGHIVVSTPNTYQVSVYNSQGSLLTIFPSQFVKQPQGVAVDSHGRVLVADAAADTVSLFTIEGYYIQQLIKSKIRPTCIALLEDKYLLVGTHHNGLYQYELEYKK